MKKKCYNLEPLCISDQGVDLILDCIGESFYEQNMKSIRTEGRWVLYGLLGRTLRNTFNFWSVHGIMNTLGLLQSRNQMCS